LSKLILYYNITEVTEKQAKKGSPRKKKTVGRRKRPPKYTEHSGASDDEDSPSKPKMKKAPAVRKARDDGDEDYYDRRME
jgi:hypothetical protein